MKIYLQSQKAYLGQHNFFITPGKEHPETKEFFDEQGNPLQIPVQFNYGMAEVPDNIGRYLIKKELASKSKILLN